jgi:hypothetical protein
MVTATMWLTAIQGTSFTFLVRKGVSKIMLTVRRRETACTKNAMHINILHSQFSTFPVSKAMSVAKKISER